MSVPLSTNRHDARAPLSARLLACLAVILIGALGACGHTGEAEEGKVKETLVIQRPGKPPVAASPQAMLKKEGVRELQRALRARGIEVPVDGRFGGQTREALLTFQERQGLAQTSMPDLKTLQMLGMDPYQLYQDLASEPGTSSVTPPG